MGSVRLSETGKRVFSMLAGTAAFCSVEYYLFNKALLDFTKGKFQKAGLPDYPEYAEEVAIDTGSMKFMFRHRGGSTALNSVLHDTFSPSRFLPIVGIQFFSVLTMCFAILKERRLLQVVGLGLLVSNLMLAYPAAHSCFELLKLGEMVAAGNQEVWANLNEVRLLQRMEEAASPSLKLSDQVGLYSTLALCFYCSPVLTSLTSAAGWLYFHNKAAH